MMRPVQRLSRELTDQIAAGEVVERPASVVKELAENALDAQARSVRVEIEEGGLDRIVVIDDGHGMDRDSALLAIERHATSKLATFDELFRLTTFGFRGEALPSIASVSRFKLTTRTADSLAATEVTLLSGKSPHVREVGAPQGTMIEVVDLFYNVPARRKFIKTPTTEAAHVADVLLDLALARHDVALTYLRDGRVVRQYLRVQDRATRARDAMARSLQEGAKLADEFVWVSAERPTAKVEALLSPPERARSGANGLHLLVNGRAVRDRMLARAVAMAFGSVLDPGRYPLGVVYLEVPTHEVDVNVHPQKSEVRFARGRDLYDDVTRGLAGALAESFRRLGRTMRDDEATPPPYKPTSIVDRGIQELSEAMGQKVPPFSDSARKMQTSAGAASERDPWGISADPPPIDPGPLPPRVPETTLPSAQYTSHNQYMVFGRSPEPKPKAESDDGETTLQSAPAPEVQKQLQSIQQQQVAKGAYGSLKFLAQVRATYLLCEGSDGIYVIDQHAAAERVNFFKLRNAYAKRAVQRQQLIMAEVVNVSSAESAMVDEMRETFLSFGVDARAIGDGRVAVLGIPALMPKAPPGALLRDLLDEVARTGNRNFSDAADLVLATMACHGSARAGEAMHPEKCLALLRSLDEVDFAGYCPHGRPIVTSMSYVELEKKVGRR